MQPHTEEHKDKISKALTGIKRSPETRAKMSAAKQGVTNDWSKGKQPIISCPICGKEGGQSLIRRWHFDNCKYKDVNL